MNSWKEYQSCDRIISLTVVKDRPRKPFTVTKNVYYWNPDEERKMKIEIEYYEDYV